MPPIQSLSDRSNVRGRRPGFTLVELLVVISAMLLLSALIVGVFYTSSQKQLVATGATNFVGWCKFAQQDALRDQKPYGIRLSFTGPTGTNPLTNLPYSFVTGAQYIEQPASYTSSPGAALTTSNVTANTNGIGGTATVRLSGQATNVDFWGGWGSTSTTQWPVQPNDYVEVTPGGNTLIAQITAVTQTTLSISFFNGDSAAAWTFTSCPNWQIVRQPRVMIGSLPLSLPPGIAINLNCNTIYAANPGSWSANASGYVDVLFSPTGAVIPTPGMTTGNVQFWFIDTSIPNQSLTTGSSTFQGQQFIVTIASRTGLISINQVDVTTGGSGYSNPYSLTQDGHTSGF